MQEQQRPGPFGYDSKHAPDGTPLSDLPDRLADAPDIEPYLMPHQRVIYVEHVLDVETSEHVPHPSSLQALTSLMGVERLEDIGKHGPGNAAAALPEHEGNEQVNLLGALFGRDALHMGRELYSRHPVLLETTAIRLAELMGVERNSDSEEEPGRIIHWAPEADDPIARHITETKNWKWPNYGAIDTDPMFIQALIRLEQDKPGFLGNTVYQGRDEQMHTMEHSLYQATTWLTDRLDANPDGLLEFHMSHELGIWNQAWKDTPESYVHADGTYANHNAGIASIEIQALAYDTLLDMARFAENRDDIAKSQEYRERARRIHQAVLETFWQEDYRGGYFALGTDRDEHGALRPLAVRSSNMGHALHLLNGDDPDSAHKQQALIRTLFLPEMLDRNGIRTLSMLERRFAPRSYHCGSVWGWDNDAISQELERAGYPGLSHELDKRLWSTVDTLGFFTEFVPGDNSYLRKDLVIERIIDVYDGERDHYSNSYRIEKPAQQVQAWTVAAIRRIKRKNQPLFKDKSAPIAAIDPAKRAFEEEILASL